MPKLKTKSGKTKHFPYTKKGTQSYLSALRRQRARAKSGKK